MQEKGNLYGTCMEYVWNSYGIPMEQHARNTRATPKQQANYALGAGCGGRGGTEGTRRVGGIDSKAGNMPVLRFCRFVG